MGFAASKCCCSDDVLPDDKLATIDNATKVLDDKPVFSTAGDETVSKEEKEGEASPMQLELQKSFSMGTASLVAVKLKKSLSDIRFSVRSEGEDQDGAMPDAAVETPKEDLPVQVDEKKSETPPQQSEASKAAPSREKKETASARKDGSKQSSDRRSSLSSGMLTKYEVSLVERSWMKVEELGAEKVGLLLFKNIFTIEPKAVQAFSFRNEPGLMNSVKLKEHVVRVVNTVGVAVANLRNLKALVPVLQDLALKHVGFGIVPLSNSKHKEYYGVVGRALLKTLQQGLSKDFTPELEVAWAKVYTLVGDTMINASVESSAFGEKLVVKHSNTQ